MNQYVNQYKKTAVNTASKEQILLMLYDGAIKFLHKAKLAFETKDIEQIHINLTKAERIITEFQSTLDMENGGRFAEELYALYEYLNNKLFLANIKKRTDYVDEVLKHLTELRDTWREAIMKFKAEGHSLAELENSGADGPPEEEIPRLEDDFEI